LPRLTSKSSGSTKDCFLVWFLAITEIVQQDFLITSQGFLYPRSLAGKNVEDIYHTCQPRQQLNWASLLSRNYIFDPL